MLINGIAILNNDRFLEKCACGAWGGAEGEGVSACRRGCCLHAPCFRPAALCRLCAQDAPAPPHPAAPVRRRWLGLLADAVHKLFENVHHRRPARGDLLPGCASGARMRWRSVRDRSARNQHSALPAPPRTPRSVPSAHQCHRHNHQAAGWMTLCWRSTRRHLLPPPLLPRNRCRRGTRPKCAQCTRRWHSKQSLSHALDRKGPACSMREALLTVINSLCNGCQATAWHTEQRRGGNAAC